MAEQSVTLNPSESKMVSFEAIPHEAKTYQVSVNGLTGSFVAMPAALEIVITKYSCFRILSIDGKNFTEVGIDPDGTPYGVLSAPAKVVSTYVTDTMPWSIRWRLAPPNVFPLFYSGKYRIKGKPACEGCVLSFSEGWSGRIPGPGTTGERGGIIKCTGRYHDTCSIKGTYGGQWTWEFWRDKDGYERKAGASFRIKNMLAIV